MFINSPSLTIDVELYSEVLQLCLEVSYFFLMDAIATSKLSRKSAANL